MDVDDIQNQACKFPTSTNNKAGDGICGWPAASSRIVRVSRASGGKDRHSKVWTSKGLRDRRVRLSVTTAIQFYDLQDRLGYDQPSKAVEWLLKAAQSSISELPSLNTSSFPDTPRQLSDEKRSHSNDLEMDMDPKHHHNYQNVSLSKSACSSTSDTSKGSISRSEIRIKARERARGRAAEKEKEKESESLFSGNVTPNSSSFTELLTSGNCPAPPHLHKSRQWAMDYFNHFHLGNSLPQPMMISPFTVTSGDEQHQHFSFVQDNHLVPLATATGGSDYNSVLNFSISPGLAGFNRGTLQSNLSTMPQRMMDGPHSSPLFTTSALPNGSPTENHPHHHQGLQLYYGDAAAAAAAARHPEQQHHHHHHYSSTTQVLLTSQST